MNKNDQEIADKMNQLLEICIDRLENNDPYFEEFIEENKELLKYFDFLLKKTKT